MSSHVSPVVCACDTIASTGCLVSNESQAAQLLEQALEALTAEAPLVLLIEDLHWSDFSTLELIAAVARRSEAARLLILGTYRPVEMLTHDHPLRTMKQELELHRYCRRH